MKMLPGFAIEAAVVTTQDGKFHVRHAQEKRERRAAQRLAAC